MKRLLRTSILLAAIVLISPKLYAQVGISVRIGPPALPVYVQPPCPVDGYLWEPGYWAYNNIDGYYWVPGVWVAPPRFGLLWTPCYWGYSGGFYVFHRGYWGPHVGFYGGINYGFGYPGVGFYGGGWNDNHFRYNTAVFNVNRSVVRNVYTDRRGFGATNGSRASFNGPGGVNRQPNSQERRFMGERHIQPTHSQISHQQMAGRNPAQRMSTNHGRPANMAMNRVSSHVSAPARMSNRVGNNSIHGVGPGMNRGHESNFGANRAQHNMQPQHMEQHNMQPRMQQHDMGGAPHMGGGGFHGGGDFHGGGGGFHGGGGGGFHGGGGGGGHHH